MGFQYTGTSGNDTIIAQGGFVSAGVVQQNIIEIDALTDIMLGGLGDDVLSGVDGTDSLNGQQGNDTVIGGSGNDTLEGGSGNDLLEGGLGADSMNGGFGIDTVSYFDNAGVTVLLYLGQATDAGGSVDTLLEFENVNGSNAADVIVGDAGANSLAGLGGNDLLEGGAGDDTLDGGTGNDTVSYFDAGAASVSLALGTATDGYGNTDTLISIENVNGSTASDVIVGDAGANGLFGFDGDDLLEGGAGDDTLDGGNGKDTVSYFDAGAASVSLALGTATDGYGNTDTLISIENVNGSTASDVIEGNGLGNILRGLDGDDTVAGLDGEDFAYGDQGADSLAGGDGSDVLTDHTQFVTLFGGNPAGGEFLASDADTLLGGNGNDALYASGGGDVIGGGADIDLLVMDFAASAVLDLGFTMAAGDTAWEMTLGGAVAATIDSVEVLSITGTAGADTMDGAAASFGVVFDAQDGNDRLTGGAGADILNGAGGKDRIVGGGSDDLLYGAAGKDRMAGGTEADTFRYDVAKEGKDVIEDFLSGTDSFQIWSTGFKGGLKVGMDLDAKGRFTLGTAAVGTKGEFVYDQASGDLWWDVDGIGAKTALLIADLGAGTLLAGSDFMIV